MNMIRHRPDALLLYLAAYHGSRDFFECHEIMEEYWKQQAGTRHESCWLALIRIAVACYHMRRGNRSGACKMMEKALQELNPALIKELGLDGRRLADRMREALRRWNAEAKPIYEDLDLPISDPHLMREAERVCREHGWVWGTPSDQIDPAVIHRHLTRDRSGVIEARLKAAEQKRRERAPE